MMQFVILYSLLMSIAHASIIQTQFDYEFYNKSITCAVGEPCQIVCGHSYSCQRARIYCAADFACSIDVAGTYGASYAIVYAEDAGNLSLTVSSTNGAENSVIYGPTTNFALVCSFSSSCLKANIYIANIDRFSAQCTYTYSCDTMRVFADHANTIELSCSGSRACEYLQLYQQSPPQTSHTLIDCAGYLACQYSVLKCNSRHLHIDCGYSTSTTTPCYFSNIYHHSLWDDEAANATVWCGVTGCSETDVLAVQGTFDVSVVSQVSQTNFRLYCGVGWYHRVTCNWRHLAPCYATTPRTA